MRAKLQDGTKISIWRDQLLPRGEQVPEHRLDVQFTALDAKEWWGKMILKIPVGEELERTKGTIEKVRLAVERAIMPDITMNELERPAKQQSETPGKDMVECPACLADSIGLCSIHERDIGNCSTQKGLAQVPAQAGKGGIQKFLRHLVVQNVAKRISQ